MPTSPIGSAAKRERDRHSQYRKRHGISICYTCAECGRMHGKGFKYCEQCRNERHYINLLKFRITRTLFAKAHDNQVNELREIRAQMIVEDGKEFTEELMGAVCKMLKVNLEE